MVSHTACQTACGSYAVPPALQNLPSSKKTGAEGWQHQHLHALKLQLNESSCDCLWPAPKFHGLHDNSLVNETLEAKTRLNTGTPMCMGNEELTCARDNGSCVSSKPHYTYLTGEHGGAKRVTKSAEHRLPLSMLTL